MRLPVLCCALLIALLAAPANADDTIKSVGIISAIGDTMTKQHVGLMVFGNTDEKEAIDSWQVDEFVISEISAALAGQYEIKPVSYAKTDFIAHQKGIVVDSDFDGEASIKHVAPEPGKEPDAYIIVTKAFSDDYIGQTNQHLFGVGLYEHRDRNQAIYVSYEVNVVDGHTLKYMTDRYPHGFLDFGVTGDYDRMVYREASGLWADGFVMTPEQKLRAQETLKSALREGIAKALKDFGFKPGG